MDGQAYAIIGIVFGFVFLISLVAIVGGLLQARRERTLNHAERMKALELGRELPDDVATARIKAAFGQSSAPEDGGRESLASKRGGPGETVPHLLATPLRLYSAAGSRAGGCPGSNPRVLRAFIRKE